VPIEPFSKLLRRLRRAAHLTQEELAERAGYSPDYVSMLERGLRSPPPLTIDILAKALRLEATDRAALLEAAGAALPSFPEPAPQTPPALAEPTPDLIGRDSDEATALDTLRRARLVTMVGPGGVGKTRLAARIATRAASRFAHGSVFVDLTPVVSSDGVVAAIGAALGRVGDGVADVRARLRSCDMLLVLDGFERFQAATSEVAELLASAPKLKILVTSRAALRLQVEHEIPVAPLELPVHGSDASAILASPAVALFVRRAQAIDPRFECAPERARTIAAICARLDGLPLAIELAAVRLKHMSLVALADHLKLDLLTGGPRDLPVRHQSMRDTIAWSYDLLSALEKQRLSQLSVFVGSFTLEAAEAVCEDEDALSVVASLVDKSLVVVDHDTAEPRYFLFDTIREFANELLASSPELEPTRRRHAAHFTRFAEASEAGLRGQEQLGWYRRVEADHGNLRCAIEYLLATDDAHGVMRLAGSVWLFWQSHGDYQAGKWLEQALERDAIVPAALRSKTYWGAAWLAFRRGDIPRAVELEEALLTHAERAGDALAARNALTVGGHVAMARGDFDEAITQFEQGLVLCRPIGTSWHLAMSSLNLGVALLHARRLREAETHLSEALEMHRTIGDEIFAARSLGYLGYVALFAEDLGRAEACFTESTRASEERADEAGMAEGLAGLAAVRAAQGRDAEAVRFADASETIRARSGWRPLPSDRAAWMRYLERTGARP
jgi:predicted ATPase/DNA-binding XRE family transcriptional regulator